MSKSKGDEAAVRFQTWAASHPLSYFREIANSNRTQLVRTFIMDAIGVDRPALHQNSQIQQLLKELEDRLRAEGVLVGKPVESVTTPDSRPNLPMRSKGSTTKLIDVERLARLEKEITAKDAELAELRPLRGENKQLKLLLRGLQAELSSFNALEDVLRESGRLPR